jgi:cell wall-associated NlpC family hydrolase
MPTTIRRQFRRALAGLLAALTVGLVVSVSPVATGSAEALSLQRGLRVVHVAASKKGAPYKFGAEGPRKFDCSGFTMWTFRHVGRSLPRLSRDQYRATAHVSRSHRRRGDLVFFHSGKRARSIYHVGIYAGRGMMWDAPHTGARVRKERVWAHNAWYGRVR